MGKKKAVVFKEWDNPVASTVELEDFSEFMKFQVSEVGKKGLWFLSLNSVGDIQDRDAQQVSPL